MNSVKVILGKLKLQALITSLKRNEAQPKNKSKNAITNYRLDIVIFRDKCRTERKNRHRRDDDKPTRGGDSWTGPATTGWSTSVFYF